MAIKPIPTIRIVILAGNGNTSNTINRAAVIASIRPNENWIIDLFLVMYLKLEMRLSKNFGFVKGQSLPIQDEPGGGHDF